MRKSDTQEFAKVLKRALRCATGRPWSVTTGHGTAREITHVDTTRARRMDALEQGVRMTLEDRGHLNEVFNFPCFPGPTWGGLSIHTREQPEVLATVIRAVLKKYPAWTWERILRGEWPA